MEIKKILTAVIFDPVINGENVLQTTTKLGTEDPITIAYNFVNWSLIFLGLMSTIMIIASGFTYLFSAGNEERAKKAVDIFKGTVMALLLILTALGISEFIFSQIQAATLE